MIARCVAKWRQAVVCAFSGKASAVTIYFLIRTEEGRSNRLFHSASAFPPSRPAGAHATVLGAINDAARRFAVACGHH
jgi:hypothetical protein